MKVRRTDRSRARSRRALPSVDALLRSLAPVGDDLPHAVRVAVIRRHLAVWRASRQIPPPQEISIRVSEALASLSRRRIGPVINGTGVVLHTNLGRAPLSEAAAGALAAIAGHYTNLEWDRETGQRGRRGSYGEMGLAMLCGAPAAAVVNNGAAALVLLLRHATATRKEVLVSRGELIQIGGGFRIPEILETSGAVLREVGTTNRTSLRDYQRAISAHTALILRVHRSNFFMGGFVESPSLVDLAAMARRRRVLLVEDLGSGALVDTAALGAEELGHEPTPRESLRMGVDAVCFSGDKLLGGPQAGILAGRASLIERLQRHPLFRALRCDRLVLAALQATVEQYLAAELSGGPPPAIPVLEMLRQDEGTLRARGEAILRDLKGLPARVALREGRSQVGGGTLPQASLASVCLAISPAHLPVAQLAALLRRGEPPVIGRVTAGRLNLDLRTVLPHQDRQIASLLIAAFAGNGNS